MLGLNIKPGYVSKWGKEDVFERKNVKGYVSQEKAMNMPDLVLCLLANYHTKYELSPPSTMYKASTGGTFQMSNLRPPRNARLGGWPSPANTDTWIWTPSDGRGLGSLIPRPRLGPRVRPAGPKEVRISMSDPIKDRDRYSKLI